MSFFSSSKKAAPAPKQAAVQVRRTGLRVDDVVTSLLKIAADGDGTVAREVQHALRLLSREQPDLVRRPRRSRPSLLTPPVGAVVFYGLKRVLLRPGPLGCPRVRPLGPESAGARRP